MTNATPYVNRLLELQRHGRDERFLDRMLLSSIIECRGAERFGIIAQALEDPPMAQFYSDLYKAETKHGHLFVDMVLKYFDAGYGVFAVRSVGRARSGHHRHIGMATFITLKNPALPHALSTP